MKAFLFFFILFLGQVSLATAQTIDCYKDLHKKGLDQMNKGNYQPAIDLFFAARYCDKADTEELDRLITQAQKKWVHDLQSATEQAKKEKEKAEAARLNAEAATRTALANDYAYKAQTLLRDGDRTGAFRLAEFAATFVDSTNSKVMQALIDSYYADRHPDSIRNSLPWSLNFIGHSAAVNSVAFSPYGKYVLTGSKDNTAKLWDLNGKEIQAFSGHSAEVRSVAFSPDGQQVLTGSHDGTAKLWDLNGKEVLAFTGHVGSVLSVAFSPDGKYVLTGSTDKTARLWDLNGWEMQAFSGHSNSVFSVDFSPDGKYILTGSTDKTAKLWDLNGKEVQAFTGQAGYVSSVAFSPDGEHVLTGSHDGTAKLWDLDGRKILAFEGHSGEIWSVAFSPDGRYVLTGSGDNTAKLWDLNGKKVQVFEGHSGYVSSVAFSPDGQHVLTGSRDNTAKLWGLDGRKILAFEGHSGYVSSVAFSPDGRYVLTGSGDKTAKLWDLDGRQIQAFEGHSGEIWSVAFSPDGKYVLTGSFDKTARLWDLNGKQIHAFEGHSDEVWSVAFSPDGKYVLTGSWDKTARLWDLDGREVQVFSGHSAEVSSVAFPPDGKYVLTVYLLDYTARLWDLNDRQIQVFEGHSSIVSSVTFSPDGKYILTGSWDKTARLWDLNGREVQVFSGHSAEVSSVAFSPDGKYVLTGSMDNTAKLWRLNAAVLLKEAHENRHYSALIPIHMREYGMEDGLKTYPDWFDKIRRSNDLPQIIAWAQYFHKQAMGVSNLELVSDDYENAKRLYALAIELGYDQKRTTLTYVYMDWAARQFKAGQFKAAFVHAQDALRYDSTNADARRYEGHAFLLNGHFENAFEHYKAGIQNRRDFDVILEELKKLRYPEIEKVQKELTPYMEEKVQESKKRQALVKFQNTGIEIASLRKNLSTRADSVSLANKLYNYAWYAIFALQPDTAIVAAQEALTFGADLSKINLSHGYLFSGQYERALEVYEEIKNLPQKRGTMSDTILHDFRELKEVGIRHPDMLKAATFLLGRELTEEEREVYE